MQRGPWTFHLPADPLGHPLWWLLPLVHCPREPQATLSASEELLRKVLREEGLLTRAGAQMSQPCPVWQRAGPHQGTGRGMGCGGHWTGLKRWPCWAERRERPRGEGSWPPHPPAPKRGLWGQHPGRVEGPRAEGCPSERQPPPRHPHLPAHLLSPLRPAHPAGASPPVQAPGHLACSTTPTHCSLQRRLVWQAAAGPGPRHLCQGQLRGPLVKGAVTLSVKI